MLVKTEMYTVECCNCGMLFGFSEDFERRRREDHEVWYCPRGHSQVFYGETKAEKLQKKLDKEREQREDAERNLTRTSQELATTERQRAAAKGQLTKVKNRIAKGVCPCCNRSFENLHNHMTTQHPDYAEPKI